MVAPNQLIRQPKSERLKKSSLDKSLKRKPSLLERRRDRKSAESERTGHVSPAAGRVATVIAQMKVSVVRGNIGIALIIEAVVTVGGPVTRALLVRTLRLLLVTARVEVGKKPRRPLKSPLKTPPRLL